MHRLKLAAWSRKLCWAEASPGRKPGRERGGNESA